VVTDRGGGPSLPLFTVYAGTEDDELTTADVATALRFLDQRRTAYPEDAG
jgi:hypothetical protein